MELEVPKRPIWKLTLYIVTIQRVLQWERRKKFSYHKSEGTMAKKCRFNFLLVVVVLLLVLLPNVTHIYEERREGKEKVENEEKSQNYPFWIYLPKKN